MGVRYSIEGEPKILDSGRANFRINKKLPAVPDWWWPKPYEFEDYMIRAVEGKGAVVNYRWSEGEIGGEGDDFMGDEKEEEHEVAPGNRQKIGSIVFDGY